MAVDFVYGNFPIQPNAGRVTAVQGRPQDTPLVVPTTPTTLDPALDNHAVVTTAYNGYPNNTPRNKVPNVVGLTLSMARLEIQKAGFLLGTVAAAPEDPWADDTVVAYQSLEAGTTEALKSVIDISSTEPEPAPVG